MPKIERIVSTISKEPSHRLPQWATKGAMILECLHRQGHLSTLNSKLQVSRQGGYTGIDIFIFFLFFFAAHFLDSIKEFGELTRTYRRQLAAIGERKCLASPASVSRFLSAVDMEHCQGFDSWLLLDACGARNVLSHPATWTRDTHGERWQVFDLDPTSTVLRQRALPSMEGMPEGKRRSNEAKLGYTGRKRGDVQLSRTILQHAGSGLWMGIWTAPGNGSSESLKAAISRVAQVCQWLDHPKDRALIRIDGAGASRSFLTACQDAGVCYLTRWCNYELLNEPEVRRYLNEASWFEVPDSGSGPRRQATELGWMTIPPTESSRRSDGGCYEPITSRFIVSRFPIKKKHGAGVFIDGWQYELYTTNLAAGSWPAPEAVMTYYGRCGQENRFHQEDRELALDRIFSYHLPGQHLANIIGLFVWNFHICRGMELYKAPPTIPSQPPRTAKMVASAVKLEIVPSVTSTMDESTDVSPQRMEDCLSDGEKGKTTKSLDEVMIGEPSTEDEQAKCHVSIAMDEAPSNREAKAALGHLSLKKIEEIEQKKGDQDSSDSPLKEVLEPIMNRTRSSDSGYSDPLLPLLTALDELDWPIILARTKDWVWDVKRGGLLCPNEISLPLYKVIHYPSTNRWNLLFIASLTACKHCKLKRGCTMSDSPNYRRQFAPIIPEGPAKIIQELLKKEREIWRPQPRQNYPPSKPINYSLPQPKKKEISIVEKMLLSWQKTSTLNEAGANEASSAILLPATVRKGFSKSCNHIETEVKIILPSTIKPKVPIFAATPGERQHRRHTWEQRHHWNALPIGTQVYLSFAGGISF